MKQRRINKHQSNDNTVIGIISMILITVILAGVIGYITVHDTHVIAKHNHYINVQSLNN